MRIAYVYLFAHIVSAVATAVMVRIDIGMPVFGPGTDAAIAASAFGFIVFGCAVIAALLSPAIVAALFVAAAAQRSDALLRVAVWDIGATIVHWVALVPAFQ